MKGDILTFKYEPQTFDEMILDPVIRSKLKKAFTETPNLMLIGPPGVGKGTFTSIFLRDTKLDFMKLNCSDETSVETMRTKVKSFATSLGITEKKIVVLNESDYISINGQAMLRDLMEQVQDITRFIFLCNYGHKMIPELLSRCQVIQLDNPPKGEILNLIKKIIIGEKIKIENPPEILELINTHYPDIRRIINTLQYNIVDGKIEHIKLINTDVAYEEIFKLMKESDLDGIRKALRSNSINYVELYQFLFEKAGEFKSPGDAILEIGDHLYKDSLIAIKEINFIHCVVKMLKENII